MASVNKAILVGNLGRDPETRSTQSGEALTTLSIATTDSWRDKATGERREATEWHRVLMFGKLAEIAGQYLRKGSSVYVEGRLRTRKYTDKSGIERYTTEILADSMQMLGGRGATDGGAVPYQSATPATRAQQPTTPPVAPPPGVNDIDDDIPF